MSTLAAEVAPPVARTHTNATQRGGDRTSPASDRRMARAGTLRAAMCTGSLQLGTVVRMMTLSPAGSC